MDESTKAAIYDQGYMCEEGTPNPYPPGSEGNAEWQRGYDESIRCNYQNLSPDHPDVVRLGLPWPDDED